MIESNPIACPKTSPYDWRRPVSDPRIFAGRTVELEIIYRSLQSMLATLPVLPSIAISGERRVGKTSLLNRVVEKCQSLHLLPLI